MKEGRMAKEMCADKGGTEEDDERQMKRDNNKKRESLDNVTAKSGDKQRERKPNDNEGKSEAKVCDRVKTRIKENQTEESQGLGVGTWR